MTSNPTWPGKLLKASIGSKAMIKRLLDQEQAAGNLRNGVDTGMAAEIIFSGILGACVSYTSDKSKENLDHTIKGLIDFLTMISL